MSHLPRQLWIISLALALASCGKDDPSIKSNDDLTAPDAVEKQITIQGYIYTDANASSYTIESAVKRQVRTAFGPLRIAKISVDDRELKSNVDPQTFQETELELVKKAEDGTVTVERKIKRVSYTYRARALVNKSLSSKSSFSLALLMGNYQSFVSEIIKDCVENYEHDQEFSSSFWYVWSPNESSCKTLIEKETDEIQTERQGLGADQIGETEYARRFLPLSAQLDPAAGPKTTYPEYDQLYGVGDAAKKKIVVYQIMGVASHAGDPDSQRFQNDDGFHEFIKTLKKVSDQWPSLEVSSDSSVDPLSFTHDGTSYTATFKDLYSWIVNGSSYPSGITYSNSSEFLRSIYDHIVLKWIRLDVPLTVRSGHTTKEMTLELRMLFGTESGYSVKSHFKEAFKNGDVVIYNGHSYIGSGPLDPSNYSAADFAGRYQVFFFNSCVSFNYYGVDYFDMKAGGSKNLDLVTNGIEVYITNGGESMGQFITALFDGKQRTWMDILKRTQTSTWWGKHDPNRNVDGEQDNVYDPNVDPITVSEGWSNALSVDIASSACRATATGTVDITAAAPGADRVEFYADGTLISSDSSDPFSASWDSTALANGGATLTAKAYSSDGQTAESSCTTTVQNGGNTTDLFYDDMESGATGWTATGLWHLSQGSTCASPGSSSGHGAWYFGQDSGCNYKASGTAKGSLTSASIGGVTASSKLSFQYYRDVESSTSGSYDKTLVEVSSDGSTWKTLWSKDSGDTSSKAWKSSGELSLAEFAGKSIQIRFTFDSVDDYANEQVGWMVDDVRVR